MIDPPRDLSRTIFQVLFLGGLIAAIFWILQPFLLSMVWAATIVVATWPLLLFVQARLWRKRFLAVTLMTLALLLVLLVPLGLTVTAIAQNTDRVIGWAKSLTSFHLPQPPDWLSRVPLFGGMLAAQWAELADIGPEGMSVYLAPYARTLVGWFVTQIGNVGIMAVQFFLTVLICVILYTTGESVGDWIYRFARRLDASRGEGSIALAAQAVRAVALGVVVTAILQALLGAVGLAIAGVPYAGLLGTLMFVLSVAQIGVLPVVVPAVAWMYWTGDPVWATFLLVWEIPVCLLDNFLRPILIKRGAADIPLLLIFVGVVGGLIGFGIIGLFVGPVALAVGYTLLKAWIAEADGDPVANAPGSPPDA
jgi:predicted PurR-regulated permease PerM